MKIAFLCHKVTHSSMRFPILGISLKESEPYHCKISVSDFSQDHFILPVVRQRDEML